MLDNRRKVTFGIIMKNVCHLYHQTISVENLLVAWEEFIITKKKRTDMRLFARYLIENISALHTDLSNFTYKHASYERFNIQDPKQRIIHKASVRDRLLHHAIYRILYPIFDKSFIYDSYSCRLNKGTHKAVERLGQFNRKVSKNYTGPCYALKCDVKKFFDSVNHQILLDLIRRKVPDSDTLWLIETIINSFNKSFVQLGLFGDFSRERERERERERRQPSAVEYLSEILPASFLQMCI